MKTTLTLIAILIAVALVAGIAYASLSPRVVTAVHVEIDGADCLLLRFADGTPAGVSCSWKTSK